MRVLFCSAVAAIASSFSLACPAGAGDDPFADKVISYFPGEGAAPGYTDPATTLGSPERFTAEATEYPSVVSPFSAPYWFDEIVSLGAGGHLVVKFNTPVLNDPNNLYGIDLLIFGNTSFIDSAYPNGIVAGMFGDDGGMIEVSDDGQQWHWIQGLLADGPIPTTGYLDSGPFDEVPGRVLSDFTRPVDPLLSLNHFMGLHHSQVLERYRGAGGGVGIDIGATGLAQIQFVRISNSLNARENIEIDAFSDAAPRRPGDVDLDGIVNVNDLLLVIGGWGVRPPGAPPADFDNDGVVNVNDLLTVINNWG